MNTFKLTGKISPCQANMFVSSTCISRNDFSPESRISANS